MYGLCLHKSMKHYNAELWYVLQVSVIISSQMVNHTIGSAKLYMLKFPTTEGTRYLDLRYLEPRLSRSSKMGILGFMFLFKSYKKTSDISKFQLSRSKFVGPERFEKSSNHCSSLFIARGLVVCFTFKVSNSDYCYICIRCSIIFKINVEKGKTTCFFLVTSNLSCYIQIIWLEQITNILTLFYVHFLEIIQNTFEIYFNYNVI